MYSNWLDKNGNARVYIRVMDEAGGKRLVKDITDTPANLAAALRELADEVENE